MRFAYLFIILLIFISCESASELELVNGCDSSIPSNATEKTDFKKNFKLKIPSSWNVSHFYSATTSEMYAADTTKQLSESYILDLSHHDNQIILGEDLNIKIAKFNAENRYSLVDSNNINFKNSPASFYTLRGKKNNYDVLIFDLYVQTSKSTYFNAKTEIYGNQNIQERLCEALAILNTVEFLK